MTSPEHVRSLARGLAVIRAFDAAHPTQTLSDVARRTGLTRAAARRFLFTLADLGYVRTDGKRFTLTPRVLDLGYAYLSSLTLPEVAGPHLEALAARVRAAASVAVLDGDDIVYVARASTSRVMTVAITIGTRLPAHAASMGRVLLAALPEAERGRRLAGLVPLTERTVTDPAALGAELDAVRARGFSVVDEELELGLRSIAVAVRDASGADVAAVNVATRAGDPQTDLERDVLPLLRECAAAIEADLAAGTMQP